jgi:hypothetical protein
MNFNNIDWGKVFSKNFWFSIDRVTIHPSDKAFLYIGGVLAVAGILKLFYARFSRNQFLARIAVRVSKILLTIGLLEGLWYLLRTQYVQFFGTRAVALAILLWGIIWMYYPIKYLFRNYKEDMEKAHREMSREKYLKR